MLLTCLLRDHHGDPEFERRIDFEHDPHVGDLVYLTLTPDSPQLVMYRVEARFWTLEDVEVPRRLGRATTKGDLIGSTPALFIKQRRHVLYLGLRRVADASGPLEPV